MTRRYSRFGQVDTCSARKAHLPATLGWLLLLAAAARAGTDKPAPACHPVVVADGHYLLGGVRAGQWLDADAMAPLLRGGERYRVYSLARDLGTATGARSTEEMPGPYYHVDLTPDPPEAARAVAVGARWNAAPRRPVVLGTTNATYQRAVGEVLREHGLARAKVRILQALRVDLEGDGRDEVLLTAQAPGLDRPMPYTRANDYSVVILRTVVAGKVRTFLLGGGFYPKAVEPAAPYVFRVDGLLDLNGDGVLEILVADEYYEGMGMAVYQMRGGKPVQVLSGGMGA